MEDFTVTQQDLENYLSDKINSLKEELLATEKALLIFKHAQLEIALHKFKASQDKKEIQIPSSVTLNSDEPIKEASQEDLKKIISSPTSIHILTYQIKPLMTVDEFLTDACTIRLRLNYSAEKVARKFGISTSGLYFIEDGKTKGTKTTVKSISNLYGITLTDLDERYGIKENGRYQLEHKLAYVKKDKVVEVDTNGNKVKKIYAKREPKQKPVVEDA